MATENDFLNEDKFQEITELMPLPIVVIRVTDDNILHVNKKFSDQFGYSLDEIAGCQPVILFDNPEDWLALKEQSGRTEFLASCELLLKKSDSSTFYSCLSFVVKRSGDETILIITFQDISALKKTEETLKENEFRYRLLVESMHDGIGMQDKNGIVNYVNKRFCELLGYTCEEVIGRHVNTFFDQENLTILKEQMSRRKEGINTSYEIAWLHKSGYNIPTIMSPKAILDENNIFQGSFAVVTDISERKKAEEVLRENVSKYKEIFEQADEAILITDIETHKYVDANPRACEILGYTYEELLQKGPKDIGKKEQEVDYDAVIIDLRLKGKKTFIYRAYKKNREEIIFRANSKIVKRNGREYIQTFAQEITERIKAENTLKFQSQIIDQIHDSVVSTDLEGIVTSWNQGAEKMFGYHKEEMIGNSISQLYPEEDYSLFMNNIISPLKERGQLEAEVRMRRKSGSIFYGNLSLSLMRNTEGKAIGMVGYTMDISDRKKAEEEISIARDEYKSITNLIVDIIVKVNMEGKFVFVNSGAITFYGMDEEKLLQHNFRDFIHPEDLEISDVSFRELLAHKRVTGFTNRHKNPTGWSMIEWYATPVFNEHDEFNGVLATGRDITERKLTEDALQSVSLINEKIISESPIGISIYDPSGQCISSNDSMAQIVGATKEQVLSQNYNNIESWKKSGLLDKVKSALDSHQKVQYEFTITTTFGKTVSLECFLVPFSMQNKTHLLLMTDDITERKQQEEEIRSLNTELEKRVQQRTNALEETLKKLKDAQSHLVHTEKMASLGQLTAGIGHEINNPVNFINAGIHSLENNLKEVLEVVDKYRSINQDNAAELIREIEDNKRDIEYETALKFVNKSIVNIKNGVERTTQIINGLRTFSRNDNEQAALIDIHENIEATLIMLHAKYANKVTLKKCFVNLPRVECLAGKINQVLANIIGNGIDAVIENQGPDTAEINITTSMKNNEIIIEIKDNGPGMDEETLKKIFDPFYTTKEIGKGTGLGLSISYNIIKQHSGKLLVKSSLGRGTTFTVCLPLKFRGERVHN